MLSDTIYATFTLLGLSLVSGLLDEYESYLLIAGSVILIIFGIGVFSSKPLKGWQPDKLPIERRYIKDFLSAYMLTFSNVTIILALIGLYTRFTFNPIIEGTASTVFGLISFVSAAFLWWFLLTTFVSKQRKRFSRKGLIVLNKMIGSVFILIGLGGFANYVFPKFFSF